MRRSIGVPASLVAAAAAVMAAGVPAFLSAADKPCRAILVSSAEETPGSTGERFAASRTTDLTFQVMLDQSLTGAHALELKVTTPRGFLYRSLAVPIALGVGVHAAGIRERTLEGYPHPQRVLASAPARLAASNVQRIAVAFPVGGTDIVTNSLYGRWKVEAFLDGAEERCGPAARFKITQ